MKNRVVKHKEFVIEPQITKATIASLKPMVKKLSVKSGDILVFPDTYAPQADVVLQILDKLLKGIEVIAVFGDVKKLTKTQLKKILTEKK